MYAVCAGRLTGEEFWWGLSSRNEAFLYLDTPGGGDGLRVFAKSTSYMVPGHIRIGTQRGSGVNGDSLPRINCSVRCALLP